MPPIATSIIIKGYVPLSVLLRPLALELSKCFWYIDTESGPFKNFWENEPTYDSLHVHTEACDNSSASCWRPGTLPKFAEQVLVDEWTYIAAMQCDEGGLEQPVRCLGRWGISDAEFLARLGEFAEVFFMQVDGWWEIYTSNLEWRVHLLRSPSGSFERSASNFGKPPDV